MREKNMCKRKKENDGELTEGLIRCGEALVKELEMQWMLGKINLKNNIRTPYFKLFFSTIPG